MNVKTPIHRGDRVTYTYPSGATSLATVVDDPRDGRVGIRVDGWTYDSTARLAQLELHIDPPKDGGARNAISIPTPDAPCECGSDSFRIESLLAMVATINLCFTVSTGEVTAGWACCICRKSVLVTKRPDSPRDGRA